MKELILNTNLLPGQAALFYTGQTGFIIKCAGKYLLIDGYLTDYVDRCCSSDLAKWVRRYPAPIAPEELDFIDYVFCTHAHADHADPETLAAILRVNTKARFIVSNAITDVLCSYGIPSDRILGLKSDIKTVLDQLISVTAIPAAHEELHPDANGDYLEVGFRLELGNITLYHSGDCCPYPGLEERIAGCDIIMMPINGRDYYRTQVCDIIGCFDSREAILLAKNTGAKLLIPMHYDLYDINCVNPAVFVDLLQSLHPTQQFHMFIPGERFIYMK